MSESHGHAAPEAKPSTTAPETPPPFIDDLDEARFATPRYHDPEHQREVIDELSSAPTGLTSDRMARLDRSEKLMDDLQKKQREAQARKERWEMSSKDKYALLMNIAECGPDSALSNIVAWSRGFPSFGKAMQEFGAYENGNIVCGANVERSGFSAREPIKDLRSRESLTKNGKELATRFVGGTVISYAAYTGIAALGLMTAPVSIPAIVAGAAGGALGGMAAKGIAKLFTRKKLYQAEAPAEGETIPQGNEWLHSVGAKAAGDMVNFLRWAQKLAQQATEEAELDLQKGESLAESDTEGEIEYEEIYAQRAETRISLALDQILNAAHTGFKNRENEGEYHFANVDRFQEAVHKAEKIERAAGFAGSILGGGGAAYSIKAEIAHRAAEKMLENGVWMHNNQLSAEHVGHLVKHVNGLWHPQLNPTDGHMPGHLANPDGSNWHGIIDAKQLVGDHAGSQLVNTMHHLPGTYGLDSGVSEISNQAMTHMATHGGIPLTQAVVDGAHHASVDLYHVSEVIDPTSLVAERTANTWLQGLFLGGVGAGLAGFLREAVVGKREDAESKQLAHISGAVAASAFTSNLNSLPPEPPAPHSGGGHGSGHEKKEDKAKEPEKKKEQKPLSYDEFETAYAKKGTPFGKEIADSTTDISLSPGESAVVSVIPVAKDAVDVGGTPDYDLLRDRLIESVRKIKTNPATKQRVIVLIPRDILQTIATAKGTNPETISRGFDAEMAAAGFTPPNDHVTLVGHGADTDPNGFTGWKAHLAERVKKATDAGKNTSIQDATLEPKP